MAGKNTRGHNTNTATTTGPVETGAPSPSGASSDPGNPAPASPTAVGPAEIMAFKDELLSLLWADFAAVFKDEVRAVLESEMSAIKLEIQAAKTELAYFKVAIKNEVAAMGNTMEEMEKGLSGCSDDVAILQRTVQQLSTQVAALEDKCEDLEGRSRRNNIRIVGVPEGQSSCSTTAVSVLLKEAFQLEKAPLLDRAHRTLQPPPKQEAPPRAIVARLHYFHDCSNILRLARERRRVKVNDLTISG